MCHNKDFAHLHCHSHYSIQDALPSPAQLAVAASEMGFEAIALTDHGKMAGSVEFVDACRNSKTPIKPIVGLEVYTCQDMYKKEATDGRRRPKHNHLTLLAKNKEGYKNLLAISSIAASEGFYYDPRVDHKVLEEHSEGIIALSGCLASEVNQALLVDNYDLAINKADWFKQVFKDNFFVELQYHGIEEQKHNLPNLIKIANELNLPLVCSNDVHYLQKPDWAVHDVLIQMRNLREDKVLNSGKKKAYESKQFYLKTYDEMFKIFGAKVPEALSNTKLITEMVENYFELDVPPLLPKINIPETQEFRKFKNSHLIHHNDNEAYLAYLAFSGLKKRGLDKNKSYVNRLKKELTQIWFMGVTDYFLVHNEIITYMKNSDIMYGIRGSGVGSVVNYCLEICHVDPLRWGLMFERFLNPGRGTQYDLKFNNIEYVAPAEPVSSVEATKKIRELIKNKIDSDQEAESHSAIISKELWVIENQDLSPYYLDLYESKKTSDSNIVNSWVAYYLGITLEKPTGDLKIKKVATLPDVDTDIDDSKREQVINWTKQRFGEDKVSNIGAWGTYGSKAAVLGALKTSEKFNQKYKDKVHQEALKITATIPKKPGIEIDEALRISQDFSYYYNRYEDEIDIAKDLFGTLSNLSVHAGGIIVSGEPISHHAPIENSRGNLCSGYDMACVERVGLVKYDFLGLKTYHMISLCAELVKHRHGIDIDFVNFDFEDQKIYKLFKQGKTSTVFQFASPGMQDALKLIKASDMEDLIAVVSLYRPGPMEYIPEYAQRKLGKKQYSLHHELIEKHLGYTYGILIYQEQAMLLARDMAGFSWVEVDKLRKAISKKNAKDFVEVCKLFKQRSVDNGIAPDIAQEVINLMEKFAGYAFNRSHAASYAILAYWTAYLRVYYPTEWIAACIQIDIDKDDELSKYINEASANNIDVLYPDVNQSEMMVKIKEDNQIVLPLTFCKGAGHQALSVTQNKPYESFNDLIIRAKPSKTIIKALAYGNALSTFTELQDLMADEIVENFENFVKESKKSRNKPVGRKITEVKKQTGLSLKKTWNADKFFEDID